MPDSSITNRLASLPNLSKPAVCDLWRQLFQREPPREIRGSHASHRGSPPAGAGVWWPQRRQLPSTSPAGNHIRGRPQRNRFKPAANQAGTRLVRQ
jgi:hypothetical protein